jgi:hypothetical protein
VRRFSGVSLGMASQTGELAADGVAETISSSSESDDDDDDTFSSG